LLFWHRLHQYSGGQGVLIFLLIVLLVVVAVFGCLRYWCWPRTVCYNWFCGIMQRDLEFKTKTWLSSESSHFRVKYQPGDAAQVGLLLESAEEAYQPVSEQLQCFPAEKISIIMYPDRESLGRSFGWASDQSTMGVYWAGVIRVLAPRQWIKTGDSAELSRIFKSEGPMAHEYAHLLVDLLSRGNYPRWLTEGLAQYVEREVTGFALDPSPQERNGAWYDLGQMDAGFDNLPAQELAYREALGVTEYLIDRYGFAAVLNVLDWLRRGKSINQALGLALHTNIVEIESGFSRWADSNFVEKQ
jgi:hypothetical protein